MSDLKRIFYLWIDPPGDNPGWLYDCASDTAIAKAMANHDIPEDNDQRWRDYVENHGTDSVQQFQAGRDFWGITVLDELPTDLPEKIVRVK
jgi:hypothetical protein